ncbi:MAG: hemerythrin domain-containing protein [Myxococcales bacterium]
MDPIETLMTEHRLIERVLAALEAHTARVRAGEVTERAELERFARFFTAFADKHHHGKEEDILFARMVESGFSREAGPIAVMLFDHEQGRALVRKLRDLATRSEPWTFEDALEADLAAGQFSQVLSAHIRKEDQVLYPMAERHLPEAALKSLAEQVEAHGQQHRELERELVELGESLEARWVPLAARERDEA